MLRFSPNPNQLYFESFVSCETSYLCFRGEGGGGEGAAEGKADI